jgi:OFA family oxalate/formate antiporter-like MFS transporter
MRSLEAKYDRRWDLIVIGAVANMCLGTVYSWSVFRGPLQSAFGFSASQTGTPYSVFLALFAFSMPLGGWLQSKVGPRITMIAGAVLVGAGWLTAGTVSTIGALSATYGLIGGIGVGLAYGVPLAVVGSWFPNRRGLALGITLSGFGLSPFVTAPVAEALIVNYGVSAAFRILGIAFFAILSVLTLWFKAAPGGGAAVVGAPVDVGPAQMLRTKAFYGLWICFALGTFAGLTAIGMSATYGVEVVGLTPSAAAGAVAAFGVFNGAGRPLFGWITDALGIRKAAYIAFAIILIGAIFALVSGTLGAVSYIVGFALLWMLLGGWLAIAPAATTRAFGQRQYPANYGVVYTAYGFGALGGGAVSAALTRATGSLESTFWAIPAVAIIGFIVARLLLPVNGHSNV